MSETLADKQSDPNRKPPVEEKKRIEIPAWWAIVALIMAGLVYLPIQYANIAPYCKRRRMHLAARRVATKGRSDRRGASAVQAEKPVTRAAEEGRKHKPSIARGGALVKQETEPR